MGVTKALRITLSARAVIARGFAFSPRAGSFADADVALDELLSLPPPPEPLVLRVTATGGDAVERARVQGDWLCDATLGEPRRIPAPVWSYTEEATAWAKARPWLEAWETCEDARWMLHAAVTVGVDRRLVVRAACACARTVLDQIPESEERPRRAIEIAEAWARGEATRDAVREAAAVVYSDPASAYAAYAAADAAAATTATTDDASAYAAYAAANASYAATNDSYTWQDALARLTEIVRREIATSAVLRAASTP